MSNREKIIVGIMLLTVVYGIYVLFWVFESIMAAGFCVRVMKRIIHKKRFESGG